MQSTLRLSILLKIDVWKLKYSLFKTCNRYKWLSVAKLKVRMLADRCSSIYTASRKTEIERLSNRRESAASFETDFCSVCAVLSQRHISQLLFNIFKRFFRLTGTISELQLRLTCRADFNLLTIFVP